MRFLYVKNKFENEINIYKNIDELILAIDDYTIMIELK